MRIIFILLIIFSVNFLFSCSEKHSPNNSLKNNVVEMYLFDTSKLKDATELNSDIHVNHFTNFRIVYFDKNSLKIYLELDNQVNKYYFTSCTIDSVMEFNLLNQNKPEQVYKGKFNFISPSYGNFTFLAFNIFDKVKNNYRNFFNDYFILDNSEELDLSMCEKFVNNTFNALLASYSEGTGNYLDYKIYGFDEKDFKVLGEPTAPLENGLFAIDSSSIYFLEGVIATKLSYKNNKIQYETLSSTPIFNQKSNDRVLEIKDAKNGNYTFPKFVVIGSDASLHLLLNQNGKNSNNNITFNFDHDYWNQNFNTLIPKMAGMTTITFENSDKIIIGKVRVIIRQVTNQPI